MKYYKKDLEILALEHRDINNPSSTPFNLEGWQEISSDHYQHLLDRWTGRTTRLADSYIQQLFSEGFVEVRDHHTSGRSGHEHLFSVIFNRLKNEHSHLFTDNRLKFVKTHNFRSITLT